jgi:hypothetical protein
MNKFVELQREVDSLPEQEQNKLAAYLTMLRKSREAGYDESLAARVAEDAPESWVAYNRSEI